MRTFATMFVSGALGLLLLKLVLGLVGPLLAMMFGFLALAFKLLLFAALAYFVYSLVRGKKRESQEVS